MKREAKLGGQTSALTVVLLVLALVSSASAANYVLKILGSTVGDHATEFEQAASMAKYAAAQVSLRWGTDTLTVETVSHDESPVLVATHVVDVSEEADVIGLIGPGDEFDSLASVVAARVDLPMVSYSQESNQYDTTDFPFVSLHPPPQIIVQGMLELYQHFGWTRIGVMHASELTQDILGLIYFYQIFGIELVPITIAEVGHSYYHLYEQVIQNNLNVIVIVANDVHDANRILSGASEADLMRGRAWIVYADHESTFESPYQGVLTFQEVEGLPQVIADFETLLQSLNPATYPGTGPSAELLHSTALAYDAVNVYAAAIDSLKAQSMAITRANVISAVRGLQTVGVIGHIGFDAKGLRQFGTLNFLATNENGVQETFMTYNGTLDPLFTPVWPGNSLETPVTNIVSLPIAVLVPFDLGISQTFIATTRKAYEYSITRMNTVPDLLPPGYRMVPYLFDHSNSGMSAVQYAANASRIGITAAIGSTVSRMSGLIQNVLGGAGIPQLSPSSTDADLSIKSLYPTFMRMSSTSREEAGALVALIKHFSWRTVSLINVESDIALDFYELLLEQSLTLGSSLIVEAEDDSEDAEAIEAIRAMNPRILVVLAGPETITRISRCIYESGIKPLAILTSHAFTFRNTAVYTANLSLPEDFYEGWITTGQSSGQGPIYDYLNQELQNVSATQPGFEGVYELVRESAVMQRAFDCVYSIADSVRRTVDKGNDPRDGRELLESLYETDLIGVTGRIRFTDKGDRLPDFEIKNIRDGKMVTMAHWDPEDGLHEWEGEMMWPDRTTNVPLDREPRRQHWLKWDSAAGITLAALAGLGLLFGLVTLGVIFAQRVSPVIMSATWQFLIVMILGSMLGFGSLFVWIGYPRTWICALRIWLPPMAFIFIIAPLIAKTWRLHRIFSLKDLKTTPIPLWRLVVIVVVLVLIQTVICIFWISLGTISVGTIDAQDDLTLVYVTCSSNDSARIASYVTYGYLGLLVVFCCYLAFRVRKLPKDFNESRWIAVSIYNVLIFSVLVMILGYTLKKFVVTVSILVCIGTLAICFVAVGAMMGPKIWELIMHPERRSSSSGSTGSSKMKTTNTGPTHRSARNYSKSSTGTGGRRSQASTASSGSHVSSPPSKPSSPMGHPPPVGGKSDVSDFPLNGDVSSDSSSSESSSSEE